MYAKIQNGTVTAYPYTLLQLQQDNPYTSFTQNPSTQELADFNTVMVHSVSPPEVEYTYTIQETGPVFDGNVWKQNWVVTDATAQEISDRLALKTSNARNQRNQLLSQSDWTQVADAPVDQQAWATYRQALRDVTQQPKFPLEIIWPQQP
jgi:hypothetical protein